MKRFACPVFFIRNDMAYFPAEIITSAISGQSKKHSLRNPH